ncbi:hypothetical protein [Oligella urethralis]|uniref:Phage tail protein n=1 Tax=Oligella urethralis TaxID=90245 RepID=A0A2X1UWC3_9BURK|nr:hypothetical protein [Oligella urethralis]SPY08013.1 Uncharacterised protein [Oligella urethralis]
MKSLNHSKGVITIIRHTPSGDIIDVTQNMEVRTGAEHRAKVFNGEANQTITHIELGSGVNEVDFENTNLTSPLSDAKADVQVSRNGHVLTYTAEFPAGKATGAITELGLFAGEVLCNRATRPVINKLENESITVIWSTESVPAGQYSSI